MKDIGYIKVHRKILDNPVVCKDCETLSIWLYLLLNATHQEIPAIFKGQKITLKKGQLLTGVISISKKLMINKDKVQRTLKCFELDKQIEQQTSNKNRLITILNWNKYQSADKKNDKQMINKCETTDKQLITNNNVKNVNNIYLFLFNKYKRQFSFLKSTEEKQEIFRKCMNEKKYKKLTQEEQTKLYTRLMSLV